MLLLNVPVPLPSVVLVLRSMSGPGEIDQTIPLAVTAVPPSADTFPPLLAEVELMLLILVVLTVGRVATAPVVVKEVWLP